MPGPAVDFEVVILGGGPAGAAAAIVCRRSGLRTLVLESQAGESDRPGESLGPEMASLCGSLGLAEEWKAAAFPSHAGHWVRREGESFFQEYGQGLLGVQAPRRELEAMLLRGASAAGAVVSRGERAGEPLLARGRVAGVSTRLRSVRSAFVIDAAGGAHWLARRLGLRLSRVSRPLVAAYGWVDREGSDPLHGRVPEFQVCGSRWTWVAPVRPPRYAWVAVDLKNKTDLRQRPSALAGGRQAGPVRAADVTWRAVAACAGPGYFLAGDAAFVLDPASSRGVRKAVMSGMVAAQAAVDIWQGANPQRVQAGYRTWMGDWFAADAAALASLYAGIAGR